MPLTARLMSSGMSDPPAVTTRSRGALNTGDGGLCSGCREAACASGGCDASAITDFIVGTRRKTREPPAKKLQSAPNPRQQVANLRAHLQGGVRAARWPRFLFRILMPGTINLPLAQLHNEIQINFVASGTAFSDCRRCVLAPFGKVNLAPVKSIAYTSPCTSLAWHVSLVGQLLGLLARSLDGWMLRGGAATKRPHWFSCGTTLLSVLQFTCCSAASSSNASPKPKRALQLASIADYRVQRS